MIKGWRCGAELMCLQGGVSSERASNGTRVMVARASSIVADGGTIYCRACIGRTSVNGAAGAIGGEGLSGGGCSGLEDLLKIVARNIAASIEVSVASGSCGADRAVQRDDSNASDSFRGSITTGTAGGHVRGSGQGGVVSAAGDSEGTVGVVGDMLSFRGGAGNGVRVSVGGGDGGVGIASDEGVDIGLLSVSKILRMASSGCIWPSSRCV